jgi:hypothetical protein
MDKAWFPRGPWRRVIPNPKHMKYNINISPAWIGELGLIDDWGPEIDPKDIPVGTTRAVAVKLRSGRVHLISWKHVKDLPADDPAVAAVLVDILIDENQLFKPNAG